MRRRDSRKNICPSILMKRAMKINITVEIGAEGKTAGTARGDLSAPHGAISSWIIE
jgi:hypothetical protein